MRKTGFSISVKKMAKKGVDASDSASLNSPDKVGKKVLKIEAKSK